MMKKLFCLILLVCGLSALHAELNPPHRYFELGVDVEAAVANSWFSVTDFFQETLVVDFTKMSQQLNNGLGVNFDLNAGVNMDINVGSIFRLGVFGGLSGTGQFNLSQGIIDFLAEGNASGDHSIEAGVVVDSFLYAEAGASFQTFVKNLGISFSPVVFLPVVYIPRTEMTAMVVPSEDGTRIDVRADAAVYSILGIEQFESAINVNEMLDINTMGLDISLGAEYALFPFLDIGASVRNIPIIPGRLKYKTDITASFEYTTEGMFDSMLGKDDESGEEKKSSDESSDAIRLPEKSQYLEDPQTVRRPTYIGLSASYRPFGEWFNVRGGIDFVINTPFYVNFNLGAGFHLLRMSRLGGHLFNFTLDTGYQQRMWTQRVGLVLNLRAFELDLSVSSCSGNFLRSFMGAGLGVGVGVRLGF